MDNKRLKIGFIGANYTTKHLLNALAEEDEIIVWNHRIPDEPISKKVRFIILEPGLETLKKIIHKNGKQTTIPVYFKKLISSLKREQPDVLIVMDFIRLWYWQALWHAYRYPHTKLVLLSQTKRYPQSILGKFSFWIFLSVAKMTQRRLQNILTYHPAGTNYLKSLFPHVDIQHFVFPILENTPFYNKPTAGETIKILMPARFVAYKRHQDVVEAFKRISKNVKIEIDFVAFANQRNPELPRIRKAILDLHDRRIQIKKPLSKPFTNYYKMLKKYDAVLLPSEQEALGAVIPAALRTGRPCITSDTVGANVYMEAGLTGYIFATRDTPALAKTLEKLNKENLAIMGQRAAARMRDDFSNKVLVKQFIDILTHE